MFSDFKGVSADMFMIEEINKPAVNNSFEDNLFMVYICVKYDSKICPN